MKHIWYGCHVTSSEDSGRYIFNISKDGYKIDATIGGIDYEGTKNKVRNYCRENNGRKHKVYITKDDVTIMLQYLPISCKEIREQLLKIHKRLR